MKIYWSANQIPELAGFSANQRTKALHEVQFKDLTTRIFIYFLLFGLVSSLGNRLTHSWDIGILGSALMGAVYGVITYVIAWPIRLVQIRRRIRQYLERYPDELKTI